MASRCNISLLSTLCLSALLACTQSNPIDKELVSLYVDLRVASVEYAGTPEARIARQNILREAGYTAEQFQAEVQTIRGNPELWVEFQDAIVARLDSLKAGGTTSNPPPKPKSGLIPGIKAFQ